MCVSWYFNPETFIGWAIKNGWKKGLTIDRIDNDGNYEPDNCRFVDRNTSTKNTRLLRSDNRSGYRGVSFSQRDKRWYVHIRNSGKRKFLGIFNSARLGALRYDAEAYLLNDGRPMNFIEARNA